MPASAIHIVFGDSAAGSLRQALRSVGREDRVAGLEDDLSVGPIDPAEPRLRTAWIARELGYEIEERLVAKAEAFWTAALAPAARRTVWTSRRSAPDFAGYLELLWRLGDEPCEVVDVSDLRFGATAPDSRTIPSSLVLSPAILSADHIVAMGLLDRAVPLGADARDAYRDHWRQLRAENSPLRVLSEGGFASAPITFYDEQLLSHAAPTWRKVARIVGQVMTADDDLHRVGDLLLAARVRALAHGGRLDVRGNPLNIRYSEIRLPAAAQSSSA